MTRAVYARGKSRVARPAPRPALAALPGPPIRVHHPLAAHLVLRTSADWHHDLRPASMAAEGGTAEFRVPGGAAAWAAKPCLRVGRRLLWASGYDVPLTGALSGQDLYPHFEPAARGTISERLLAPSALAVGPHRMRVYLPPGYADQPARRYPTLYMQDGANLFYADEAFAGHTWNVAPTMDLLSALGLIEPAIVVGVYTVARMEEYSQPGYARYGRSLVEELKPAVDALYRTRPGPESTFVAGSSLGGVVSFFLAWQWPEVFGGAACLSPTFGWRNDLIARVLREPRRRTRFYVDSGGPGDNSQAARAMRDALERRGYRPGHDLAYGYFPGASHSERAWAARLHLPLAFLLGPAGAAAY